MRGNRRSVNNPEGEGSAAGDATVRIAPAEPRTSGKGLQFAGFSPIEQLPSIRDTTAQTLGLVSKMREKAGNAVQEPTPVSAPESSRPQGAGETAVAEGTPRQENGPLPEAAAPHDDPAPETPATEAADKPQETPGGDAAPETFESCWLEMVDALFQKKPAFYHQLRDYLPRYENDVIYVEVENEFQKNQLEMSKRTMLEYWRDRFRLNVDEMEFVIQEHERKKVIFTSEDKVNNMLEQRPELRDFLQVLNFRIKD